MGGAATQSTSVRILSPGATYARGAPSAEEAAPCISRLRPPLPATTLPAQAGPRCLPGRGSPCRPTSAMPPGATPGPRPTARTPRHRAARAGTHPGRRNAPGRPSGRCIRTDSLAGRPTGASSPFARTTPGPAHSSRPSRATPRPGRRTRISPHPRRPTRPGPSHSQVGSAHRGHLRPRVGSCPQPQVRRPARRPYRPQEQLHRPEPSRRRRPAGPSNCRPRTPP